MRATILPYIRAIILLLSAVLVGRQSDTAQENAKTISSAKRTSSQTLELGVMSYNVRFQSMDNKTERDGRLHPWDGRKTMVVAAIAQKDADILGLQEAQNGQRDHVVQALQRYDFHASILWKREKFGKRSQGTYKLPGTGRSLDWVHLQFKEFEGEVFVFNTHFPPALKEPDKVRLCQFVSNCINKTAGENSWAILTGDLNIHDNDSSGIQILRERAQLSDPWTDTGTSQKYVWNFWFQPVWSGYTVDWVLYRRPLRALSVERPGYNENGQYPSDHLPVYASLTLTVNAARPVARQK
jgi:endonuclease/exonuclease/phosphatase family metal-dependent hydrolase